MDGVRWELRETAPELRERYVAEGLWSDDTLTSLLVAGLDRNAGLDFTVWSRTRPTRHTIGDVARAARGFAAGLAAHGIRPGDVVAFQVPNCVEAGIIFYGCLMAGVVMVPTVHIYGPKEVNHILRESGAQAFLTIDRFGSRDHLETLPRAVAGADALRLVSVIGDAPVGTVAFADLVREGETPTIPAVHPDTPAVVGYTSGTTADPKGVVHTHRGLVAELGHLMRSNALGGRPNLVGAPVGHAIGMQGGLLHPLIKDLPINLIDVWEPGWVLEIMATTGITSGSGSTIFLTSLLDHPDCTPEHHRLIGSVGLGGSPVPAAVAARAEGLGIRLQRAYGSTEHPSATQSTPEDSQHQRNDTDGRPAPGVELRLVDDDGHDLENGPGEIWSRGPDLFAGYTNPALTAEAVDADGWYHSGDIAVRDEHGCITITDRKKDIIIRGGENISAAEVEELLQHMPGIAEVAVVAAPDARLGEHACAFVRVAPGTPAPDLDAVCAHLDRAGLARQKFPEELRVEHDLPRTASGKVQKYVLRQRLRTEATTATD